MPPIPKTKKIESLAKMLQRRFKGLPTPPERTVLEHLLYAALLENATFDQADAAYAVLESYFIDWNEIRVSTVRELADTFSMLPDPAAAGDRVRRSLQSIFEKTYLFDLEELRKKGKNLGQAVDFLREVSSCSRFMIDYATQVALGGHCIPLDEASLRVFRLLGLTQINKEGTQEDVPGLERAIPKKNGLHFFLQLHHFASGFFLTPESVEFRTLLKPLDSEVLHRGWTPPALVVPKSATKPAPQRPLSVVTVPFAPPDDDDFEEEPVGTEAEFLPDESPFRQDEREASNRSAGDASVTGEKKAKDKKKTTEPVVSPKKEEPKAAFPIKETALPTEPPKGPDKPKPKKKVSVAPPTNTAKTPSAPPAPKKTPVSKSAKSEKSKVPEKTPKSSTRQLREKKPK